MVARKERKKVGETCPLLLFPISASASMADGEYFPKVSPLVPPPKGLTVFREPLKK